MIEDLRVDNRLMKNRIGELIDLINDFRSELPRPKMKKLRKLLKGTKRNIDTHGKKELEDIMEIVFLVLMSVGKSKSEKLFEAQEYARHLWKNFQNH